MLRVPGKDLPRRVLLRRVFHMDGNQNIPLMQPLLVNLRFDFRHPEADQRSKDAAACPAYGCSRECRHDRSGRHQGAHARYGYRTESCKPSDHSSSDSTRGDPRRCSLRRLRRVFEARMVRSCRIGINDGYVPLGKASTPKLGHEALRLGVPRHHTYDGILSPHATDSLNLRPAAGCVTRGLALSVERCHAVHQRPDSLDPDLDFVACRQRKFIRRHHACPGQ